MAGPRDAVADRPQGGAAAAILASWYTQGLSDGFGDRLLMSDNTSDASLELLRFRRELAVAPGFERILRGTAARLARFDHPAFARVRSVEHLESDGGLALVSVHVEGRRLSDLFREGGPARGVHPAFVAWLIRWLAPAIAELRSCTGLAHGTIAPERIVLAADGRPLLVEQVIGRPVEALGLSPDALWTHFGLVVPPVSFGTPQLDDRSDIYQLGWVCLSLLLGRRVTPGELGADLQALIDEFAGTPDGRASSFTPALSLWIDRALRTDGGGFRSAQEACDGSRQLSHAPRPDLLLGGRGAAAATASEADSPLARELQVTSPLTAFTRRLTTRHIVSAMSAVILLQALAIAALVSRRTAAPATAAATVPIRIETARPGDIVVVDGQEAGVTPLDLPIDGSTRTIVITSPPQAATSVAPAPPPRSGSAAGANGTASPAPLRTGLRVVSPIELQVFDGSRLLGSSASGTIAAAPGIKQLEFVNEALAYRSTQTVEIRSGQIRTLAIQPPGGRVSINALPWAQVWIDGKPVGETPIAFLPLAAGAHEIVFRHPDLGEKRETLLVRSGAEERVSATFLP